MIFKVYMKDPDVLHDAVDESVWADLKDMPQDEAEAIYDLRYEKAKEVASKWFEYGEYLTVEIDTEKETIRVVPIGEDND